MSLQLSVFPNRYAICKISDPSDIPAWNPGFFLFGVIYSHNEITIICEESHVPSNAMVEYGWRLLEVVGSLDFNLVGILAGLTSALAKVNVSVFVLSTYRTDFIIVKEHDMRDAIIGLTAEGYKIDESCLG